MYFFGCPYSKHIWRGSSLGLKFDIGQHLTVGSWFQEWLKIAPDKAAIVESIKILRGIWLHRNKAVFEHVVEDPIQAVCAINLLNWDFSKLNS